MIENGIFTIITLHLINLLYFKVYRQNNSFFLVNNVVCIKFTFLSDIEINKRYANMILNRHVTPVKAYTCRNLIEYLQIKISKVV